MEFSSSDTTRTRLEFGNVCLYPGFATFHLRTPQMHLDRKTEELVLMDHFKPPFRDSLSLFYRWLILMGIGLRTTRLFREPSP